MQTAVRYKRVYVDVHVSFDLDGKMRPQALVCTNGRIYEIDRVLDVRPAYAEKAGGQGDRYRVRMHGVEKELFFEHNPDMSSPCIGRWFVEAMV